MKGFSRRVLPAVCALLAALACGKPQPLRPRDSVPAGAVLFRFTRKVTGPLDLAVDGTRVPVEKYGRKSSYSQLEVSGLTQGSHRFVLLSPLEVFGPDQMEIQLEGDQGVFRVVMAQELKSQLYGSPEPTPTAPGLPGVQARLLP